MQISSHMVGTVLKIRDMIMLLFYTGEYNTTMTCRGNDATVAPGKV